MILIIALVLVLSLSLFLTGLSLKHPQGKPYSYLLIAIDLWVGLVLIFILVAAVFDLG